MAYEKSCEKMQRVRSFTVEDRELDYLRVYAVVVYDGKEKSLTVIH